VAYAYTPGLKVVRATRVVKHRLLPIDGDVLVKVGDAVRAEDVVARTELPGDVETANVVGRLGIEASDIHRYMLKKEGEPVEEGEPLAETKPLIKWFKTVIRSPAAGTVESVSDVTGQVLIRLPSKPVEVRAYVDGRVAEVYERQGVAVETHATYVQGIFGVGRERWGELRVKAGDGGGVLGPDEITSEDAGAVLVAGALIRRETAERAFEVGVAALVAGGVRARDLRAILGHDIGVAITGQEELRTTMVVTEGFGEMRMAENTFALLKERDGARASVSGATQIRAGVIRPEVIVPVEGVPDESEKKGKDALQVGDSVRIIREPYFGRIGKVAALPPELRQVETESRVRVLEVELEGDERVVVPRANVESIEES